MLFPPEWVPLLSARDTVTAPVCGCAHPATSGVRPHPPAPLAEGTAVSLLPLRQSSAGHEQCVGTAGVTTLPRVGSPEHRAVVPALLVALTRRWLSPSRCPPAGLLRFEVPSLHVSPEAALCREPLEAAQRLSGPSLSPRQEEEEEEESESTAL